MSGLNIHQKKNLIIDKLKGALPKNGKMKGGGDFDYHMIDDVHDALRPMLVEAGISFEYSVVESRTLEYAEKRYSKAAGGIADAPRWHNEKLIRMRLVNVSDPSDFIEGVETGYGIDSQDKGPGKATSYAIKTWLVNVFHLKGQPDLEGDTEGGAEYITEGQAIAIHELLQATDSNQRAFLHWIGASSVEAITADQYAKAESALRGKAGR